MITSIPSGPTGFLESLTVAPVNPSLHLEYKLKFIIYSFQSDLLLITLRSSLKGERSSRLRTLSTDTVDFFPLLPGIYKQHDNADNNCMLYTSS